MRAPFLLLLCAACIERPFGDAAQPAQRSQVNRASLRDVLVAPSAGATAVGAVFGNAAELVAWRMDPAAMVPGQRARITLYWRCLAEMEPWQIFVHLDDATGTGDRVHAEHTPAQGRFPTDAWMPGDFIADSFTFVAPRNPALLFVGFYSQGENRLTLSSPGRGRDDGASRLLVGVLPLAH